jgi:hypothetical protein
MFYGIIITAVDATTAGTQISNGAVIIPSDFRSYPQRPSSTR